MAGEAPDDTHYAVVIDAIEKGRLIPFFGAGVNLCNRPDDYDWQQPWQPDSPYLPSGAELSKRLADRYKYPAEDWWNLLRVAQYVAAVSGETALDEKPRGQIMQHQGSVDAVAFSPDGKTVLTGSYESTARLWDVPLPALDDHDRLKLSVEVRTGLFFDKQGRLQKLTQKQWLDRKKQLKELGGPCDIVR